MHSPFRLRVLRSGSGGNAFYVEAGGTAVLIDAGLPGDLIARDLETHPQAPLPRAILLTHEHDDHARGVAALARALDIPVYANEGTIAAGGPLLAGAGVERFTTAVPFHVGALAVEAFCVPHDARDPVGFVVSHNGGRLCAATDLGDTTEEFLARAAGCDVLLVEANYDLALLAAGPYPWFLKNRILSPTGHLSNDAAARAAAHAAAHRARTVVLVHLSDVNNLLALARDTVRERLGRDGLTQVRIETVRANGASPLWALG